MRVLGIETSTLRGSVALVETSTGRAHEELHVVARAHHDEPNRHGERLLPLIEGLLAEHGWARTSLDRIGVGIGPGSFTGLRVGIALATGLALGLNIPLVGVGSLRALAAGLPPNDARLRVVVRDARRSEYFVAAYAASGEELRGPVAVPQARILEEIQKLTESQPFVVVGSRLMEVPCASGELTEYPDAQAVASLACALPPELHPAVPEYVRGANAIRPQLPPSPLSEPRS